ncbi:MAG: transcriptional regulator NrdR [Neisseria sp.]|nr:transcriptional regulator NrdR [Neisseria sp.]
MKCPFCGSDETQVIDTRVTEEADAIRRRRRCVGCDKRFNTFETAELRMPTIVKSTGERVAFDEAKLRRGLERALHKRPVSVSEVDRAVNAIRQTLLQSSEREIPSRLIGEKVMAQLLQMDQVAYVRFASVYKSFTDVAEFKRVIADLPGNQHLEE